MIDKEQFTAEIVSKQDNEWLIPFVQLGLDLDPYTDTADLGARKAAIVKVREEVVEWLKDIPGCNWSVGFVDDHEQNVMVVKWWFKNEDYPVKVSEE